MPIDDVSIQEILTPITVVGLGGAGTNTVSRLSQSGLKGVECVAIASKWPYELQKIPLARKASLYEARAPRKGFDGYPWEGLTVPRIKDMLATYLPELLSKQRLVIITAGLGGHGGFASSIVARLAREAGNLVVCVITIPSTMEGAERHRYANQALELLLAEAHSVVVISDVVSMANTLWENRIASDKLTVTVSEFFKTVDELVCEGIKAIIYPMIEPTPPQDLILSRGCITYPKDTWSDAGRSSMGIGYAKGKDSPTQALKAALACPSIEKVLGKAPRAYVILKTSPELRLIDIQESLRMLEEAGDSSKFVPYPWVFGALIDPNLKDATMAIVIMSCLRETGTTAKTFYNIATCDNCGYSVHTGFVEIQKQGFEVVYYCPKCDKTIAFITREELDTQKPLE